ncbi:MAG: hypothetical protein KAI47_25175, partial [Deltaproteobacteria bacterium]|nr:hypothetical protein [Deltaproteobacteria bacterium]
MPHHDEPRDEETIPAKADGSTEPDGFDEVATPTHEDDTLTIEAEPPEPGQDGWDIEVAPELDALEPSPAPEGKEAVDATSTAPISEEHD